MDFHLGGFPHIEASPLLFSIADSPINIEKAPNLV
jgi:hypothetical protein